MARPKSDDPRDRRLVVRLTAGEQARLAATASAAGVPVSEFARARLGVEQASAGEAREGAASTAPLRPVPTSPPAAPAEPLSRGPITYQQLPDMPPKNTPGIRWCPELMCQFRSVGAARCPVHGVETKAGL